MIDHIKLFRELEKAEHEIDALKHNVIWRYESTVEQNKEYLRKIKYILSVAESIMYSEIEKSKP